MAPRVVHHDAPANPYPPALASTLELPSVERSGGLRTEGNALVAQKIVGTLRRTCARQVLGCAHDDEAERIRESHLNHVALDRLAEPPTRVVALCGEIGEPLFDGDLDFHARVARVKGREHGIDDERHGGSRHRQANPAHRLSRLRGHFGQRGHHLSECRRGARPEARPCVRHAHRPLPVGPIVKFH